MINDGRGLPESGVTAAESTHLSGLAAGQQRAWCEPGKCHAEAPNRGRAVKNSQQTGKAGGILKFKVVLAD